MSSSSEEKKRKTTTKKPSLTPTPTLELTTIPDELRLSCFARVSRLYYPTLSLASKTFRSLMASPELYQARSSLSRTESCLYVCLRFHPDSDRNPRWFTLCLKPNQTLTNHTTDNKKMSSGYALATLPIPHSPPARSSGLVTIGSNIYNIAGCSYKSPSCSVSILDCRSHTWREAPSMRVARNYPTANVLDGKIYVTGGCEEDCDSSNSMEVFDPKTQTWELVSSPGKKICNIHGSAMIGRKIYMFDGSKGLTYEPKENSWEVGWEMDMSWMAVSYCVVDNVLYCYDRGQLAWYDTKVRTWRDLEGMEGLPKIAAYSCIKLAEYGGKIAYLWEEFSVKNKMIWCAVIALEKRNDDQIWGKVEWCDAVLMVPKSCRFVHALSATV